jgi:hypothetical protein
MVHKQFGVLGASGKHVLTAVCHLLRITLVSLSLSLYMLNPSQLGKQPLGSPKLKGCFCEPEAEERPLP